MNGVQKNSKLGKNGNSVDMDESQIRKFYAGKVILLTGFTGYLGTVILEKLLRTCLEVKRIYIMIREKKGMTIDERLNKFFSNPVFNPLREVNPSYMEKVVPVYGELAKAGLGLSPEDRRNITESVNVIIHNASMVYFEARISHLLRVNVLGTLQMLELGLESPHLEAFMYVSTAYSHHYPKTIEEHFYPAPVDLNVIEDMIKADEENENGLSKEVLDEIIGQWTNMYAFSKAVTEGVVQRFSRRTSLPCIVYKPSIITPSLNEPIPSWIGNQHGPLKTMTAIALGIVHAVHASGTACLDMVPVDLTANSLLAVIYDYAVHRQSNEPQVYNYASSDWNPITINNIYDSYSLVGEDYPFSTMFWYPFTFFVTNFYVFTVLHVLFHVIPAVLVDLVFLVRGKSPVATQILFKLSKQQKLLHRFMNGNWTIKTDKVKRIRDNMNAADSSQFPLDLNVIDCNHIIGKGILISARELLDDPIEALPAARKKYQRMKMLHYTFCAVLAALFLYFLCRLAGIC